MVCFESTQSTEELRELLGKGQSNPGDPLFIPEGPAQSSNLAQQSKQIQNQVQYNKWERVIIRMQTHKTRISEIVINFYSLPNID